MFERLELFRFSFYDEAARVRNYIDARTIRGEVLTEADRQTLTHMKDTLAQACPLMKRDMLVSAPNHIMMSIEEFAYD